MKQSIINFINKHRVFFVSGGIVGTGALLFLRLLACASGVCIL